MSVLLQNLITGTSSVEISRAIEKAVRDGKIRPGDRLPTVRALAERLEVSPTTVNAAYRSLRHRGVLTAKGRHGTSVSSAPPIATPLAARIPDGLRNLATGNPDRELLPRLDRALAGLDPAPRLYDPDVKSQALLRLATARLKRDGITARALVFTSGALDAIERVLQIHLRPGDRVIVEDPGFVGVLDLVAALGLEAVPVPVDDAGMIPDALERALARGAEALIVTPRAQNPTGAAIDLQRARSLRRILARHPDPMLIEDDHAADVCGAALHTLTSESRKRWIYTRSVSKSLGPDLRLAVVTGDAETLARLEGRQSMGMRWVSHLLQQVVVALWSDAGVGTQLRFAQRTYAARRRALLEALRAHGIDAHARSGLNVWITVADEAAVVQGLRDAGWAVAPGGRFRVAAAAGIRVTVSSLQSGEAEPFARDLAEIVRRRDSAPAV